MTDLLMDLPNILPSGDVSALENDTQRLVHFLRQWRDDYERLSNEVKRMSEDGLLAHAIDVIKNNSSWGNHQVSVSKKSKDLLKFGRNAAVDNVARSTIWYTGQDQRHETYVADDTNSIDSISSSSASDTEVVTIEGHTMSGGNRTFVTQTATLNGQTRVALTTPLNRCTRVAHADQSSTDLVGEIYAYQNTTISAGKPVDTTKIHLTVPAGENQSQKASTSLSSTDYWIVTAINGGHLNKTGSNKIDMRLEVREVGGVFKPKGSPLVMSTGFSDDKQFVPYLIIPPNADVRLTAFATDSGQEVYGDIQGFLATIA